MGSIDRLDALLRRFGVQAQQFFDGNLCDLRRFEPIPGRGFLHILRAGAMAVDDGVGNAQWLTEPTLLFYPRAHDHTFTPGPDRGVDLACATLAFDGGAAHPLVAALPDVVSVPIDEVAGLDATLDLLASEIDGVACGHRHIVDRLFEVVLLKLLRHLLDRPGEHGINGGMIGGLADPQIARALGAVHAEPGEAWTLEGLAREAAMSRSAFAARFRALVGVTPHDYLTEWRITVGKQLLRRQQPVSEVAATLGYTGSSFARVFAQREGLSPRAWATAQQGL